MRNTPALLNMKIAPSALKAIPGSDRITVTWVDNSSDESNFRLERSLDGQTGWTVQLQALPKERRAGPEGAPGDNPSEAGA